MRKQFIIPALALGIALITGTLLWAQGGQQPRGTRPGAPPHGQMRPMSMMMDPLTADLTKTLNLTSTQAKKVKAIQTEAQKVMKARADKIMPIQQKIAAEMKKEKPNLTNANKLIAQSGQEQIAYRQAAAAGIVKIKAVLTKEQLKKFPESPMFSGRFMMGMGGMHGGPRGQQPPTPPAKK